RVRPSVRARAAARSVLALLPPPRSPPSPRGDGPAAPPPPPQPPPAGPSLSARHRALRRRTQAHRARRSPSSLERVAPRSGQAEFEPIRERALGPVGADRRRFRCPKPRVTGPRHGRRTGG